VPELDAAPELDDDVPLDPPLLDVDDVVLPPPESESLHPAAPITINTAHIPKMRWLIVTKHVRAMSSAAKRDTNGYKLPRP
jgi:hypothetical protein